MNPRPWRSVTRHARREPLYSIVPRRRVPVNPVPNLSWKQAQFVKEQVFAAQRLEAYKKVCTAEMRRRPHPHVTEDNERLRSYADVYRRRAPGIFKRLKRNFRPCIQTYNAMSKLGWPHFSSGRGKADLVRTAFEEARQAGFSKWCSKCFTTCNVRLQPEPEDKERTFQFITTDGLSYEEAVRPSTELITVKELGDVELYASRTRLVFNRPVLNLWCQIVDTVINNALGECGAVDHNMYGSNPGRNLRRFVKLVDVKHMERFTAAITPVRRAIIGGMYEEANVAMDAGGYMVPSDDWTHYMRVRDLTPGLVIQFGSGDSSVAPSQKEGVLSVLIEAHVVLFGMDPEAATDAVLSGSTPYMAIMNFGDDNVWSSNSEEHLDAIVAFCGKFMDVEADDDGTFLGFSYTRGEFKLRAKSYCLKTYLNERPPLPPFRNCPNLGWIEKRKVYLKFGDPAEMQELYRLEDQLLKNAGSSWDEVERMARIERKAIADMPPEMALPNALFGKEYLLTEEQKMQLGTYDGIPAQEAWDAFKMLTAEGELAS